MEINKYHIIELRRSIRDLKAKKTITDLEILRYTYKALGYLLTQEEKTSEKILR